jgi:nucleotide-binding universal stress UspA family protein
VYTGTKVVVLIADNHASKLAMKMARALCRPRDELVLVTVVLSEDSLHYGNDLLAPFLQAEQPQQQQQQQQQPPSSTSTASGPAFVTPVVSCARSSHSLLQAALKPAPRAHPPLLQVLVKGDGRLGDVIDAYATSAGADLLVVGSQNLCVDGEVAAAVCGPQGSAQHSAGHSLTPHPLHTHTGTRADPLPAAGSFALRLVKLVRCCPVLVVKANSRGPYVRSDSSALGEC